MKYVELKEICSPKQWKTISSDKLLEKGYPVYGANGVIGFYSEYNHEFPTILITCRGATCGEVNISEPFSYVNGNAMALDQLNVEKLNIKFLYYYLKYRGFKDVISGSAQPQIVRNAIEKVKVPLISLGDQEKIVELLDKTNNLINKRQTQITVLDELTQSLFLEMFGDPLTNTKKWDEVYLNEFAILDTKMTKDFDEYEDMYHVGIDNIEKNTGKLINLKYVKDSNLTSGKYVFDERHIIYSKIRPYLNKVALPNFKGICSADSYPILSIENKSTRYFIAYLLRSKAFLNHVAQNSDRTNIPKVNKKQLNDFKGILPPFELQVLFENKVIEIEKQKEFLVESLEKMEYLYNSLVQKAFKGELFQD